MEAKQKSQTDFVLASNEIGAEHGKPIAITPLPGYVIVEPINRGQELQSDFLVLARPEYQGVPRMGVVVAMPKIGEYEIALGDTVIFDIERPESFKLGKRGFLRVAVKNIDAIKVQQ